MTGRDTPPFPPSAASPVRGGPHRARQMPTEPGSVKHLCPSSRALSCSLGGHTSLTLTLKQGMAMTDHSHRFDQLSGWCSCGLREDNRFLKKAVLVRYQPGYNPALDEQHIDQIIQTMKGAST